MRRALFAAELIVAALIVRNWAYVTTYRFYLDRRVEAPVASGAIQQFEIEGDRVVPRISTRASDVLAFATHIDQDATIHVDLRPFRHASYSIRWRQGPTERTLAAGEADGPISLATRFPTGNGVVLLSSDRAVVWVDPRAVRSLRVRPHLAALALLIAASAAAQWKAGAGRKSHAAPDPAAMFRVIAAAGAALVALTAAELALRAAGDRLPAGIAAERHDLGEVTHDARWIASARYEHRLRARIDATNEWRYGDIVRMGFIAPTSSPATLHRFRFVTDREGFRNSSVRDRFDIAALGDSFTDAMTMDVRASWPSQLERQLGVAVQNYGTAGFGPQQELLVLQDYVVAHRPRLVVLAYFAGNDLFDAEAFDDFQRSKGRAARPAPGWRVKDVFSRADTWYVVSALKAGAAWASRAQATTHAEAAELDAAPAQPAASQDPSEAAASFDRGMYAAVVRGRRVRWAFMPPYLNTLNFSETELRQRRGWSLTRDAVIEMHRTAHDIGAEFVVMFLPFKSQVYWPLMERVLTPEEVNASLRFYLEGNERPLDLAAMRRNRLAQNALLREVCETAGIPFLDTTAALASRLDTGENVYFPDESHFNETGQQVVAEALAEFIRERRLIH